MISFRRCALAMGLAAGGMAAEIPAVDRPTADYVPAAISGLTAPRSSELRELVERYQADREDLTRYYSVDGSARQRRRLREFETAWLARLAAMKFDGLGVEGRLDYLLLQNHLKYQLRLLDRQETQAREMEPLLPFAEEIAVLEEERRFMEPVDPAGAAADVERIRSSAESALKTLEAKVAQGPVPREQRILALRAEHRLADLRGALGDWYGTYYGYDPAFSWWVHEPYGRLQKELDAYAEFLRVKEVGQADGEDEPIIGDPIGAEGLKAELAHEMIAYTPEELIAIANREFAWCDAELRKASREMGDGDDWKAAMEKVKADHVPPGGQPALVRKLALEAIRFVSDRNLMTIPPLAADFWRLRMMSPEEQKVAPFFLGGDDIQVAYPTDTMSETEKVEIMRGNNVHFARATVFHELIPGHHMQAYYATRSNPHRQLFTTPFWVEGWALWWEFQFWDRGFPQTPADRMGMLFWRSHRCARIIFSLKFHLGEWTPQQCIDFLVDRVGHERATATAEVRRSFNGTYSPLYQAGYMLGALQLRELHREVVGGKQMTDRQFHDSILAGGPMPIELVRARLEGRLLPRDFQPAWRFEP